MAKKRDVYETNCKLITAFLNGKRENPKICSTEQLAEKLEKEFRIALERAELVNEEKGLYMFVITKKHD